MIFAIENGAKKLDCYGTFLTSLYMQFGFLPVGFVKFNREYNENFPLELGEPNVYALFLPDDNVSKIISNIQGNNFLQLNECIEKIKVFSDYETLINERDCLLRNNSLDYDSFVQNYYFKQSPQYKFEKE